MSCPFHGHYETDTMSLILRREQEAEEEMIQTAIAMSNSVLYEPDDLQAQEQNDLELAIVLSSSEHQSQQQLQIEEMVQIQRQHVRPVRLCPRATAIRPGVNSHAPIIFGRSPAVQMISFGISIGFHPEINEVQPDEDLPYFGLHKMYWNYRYKPVKFSDEHQWPAKAVFIQLQELSIHRGDEDIIEWQQGQSENNRCIICLTNVATRVAVPCGHMVSCRVCISQLIIPNKSNKRYLARADNGELVPTRYEIPVRCPICRYIVGMIIAMH